MYSLHGWEFWIERSCFYATTGGGGGYQIHKAYTENMKTPADLVCFVEKRRLNIATARIAELETLRDAHKAEIEELKKAVRELAAK